MPKGFYRVPDVQFDLQQMQEALQEVDSRVAGSLLLVRETSTPFA